MYPTDPRELALCRFVMLATAILCAILFVLFGWGWLEFHGYGVLSLPRSIEYPSNVWICYILAITALCGALASWHYRRMAKTTKAGP